MNRIPVRSSRSSRSSVVSGRPPPIFFFFFFFVSETWRRGRRLIPRWTGSKTAAVAAPRRKGRRELSLSPETTTPELRMRKGTKREWLFFFSRAHCASCCTLHTADLQCVLPVGSARCVGCFLFLSFAAPSEPRSRVQDPNQEGPKGGPPPRLRVTGTPVVWR